MASGQECVKSFELLFGVIVFWSDVVWYVDFG